MNAIKKEVPYQFDSQQIPMFNQVEDRLSPTCALPIVFLPRWKAMHSSNGI